METFKLKSFAKINLALRIIGKRPDGYHNIETILAKVSLADTLVFSNAAEEGFTFSTDSKEILLHQNTVVKAHKLLSEYIGYPLHVKIYLEKHIPIGAGLGGGSSNAASTLLGLKRLFRLGISNDELHAIAGKIGADTAFFLYPWDAIARGIGDELTFIENKLNAFILIVYPGFYVSTSWAYSSLSLPLTQRKADINILAHFVENGDIEALGEMAFNHLEEVVFSFYPILFIIKKGLKEKGAKVALMSGSGSSIYGLFTEKDKLDAAYKWAKASGWSAYKATFLDTSFGV